MKNATLTLWPKTVVDGTLPCANICTIWCSKNSAGTVGIMFYIRVCISLLALPLRKTTFFFSRNESATTPKIHTQYPFSKYTFHVDFPTKVISILLNVLSLQSQLVKHEPYTCRVHGSEVPLTQLLHRPGIYFQTPYLP